MRRRRLLRSGAILGAGALAGCNELRGESDEATEAVEAASNDLLEANDELGSQFEAFGAVESTVGFDASAVRPSIESARENLDAAEENARLEETRAEIDALRTLADYVAAKTDIGEGLASAHASGQDGFDSYDAEDYDEAVGHFEDAANAAADLATAVEDARTSLESIDLEALSHMDADRETMSETVDVLAELRVGYEYAFAGMAPFTDGIASFEAADAAADDGEYESADTTYQESSRFFGSVPEALSGYESEPLPEEMRPGIVGLATFSPGLADFATARAEVTRVMAAFEAALSYLDRDRYDDAIDRLDEAGGDATAARESLQSARDSLAELDDSDAEVYGVIEAQTRRDRLADAEETLEALDLAISGMGEYARGAKASDAGFAAGDQENYAEATRQLSDASDRFGDAEETFREAESVASSDLLDALTELVCLSGALAEGTRLSAEGYTALDEGDGETAQRKFEEANAAFEQCDASNARVAKQAAPSFHRRRGAPRVDL